MISSKAISIVIPTYGRESVLIDTITALLALDVGAADILVVDQTPMHDPETSRSLQDWSESGAIRHFKLSPPNIPRAMNLGLLKARTEYVLFLDDDIVPSPVLIAALVHVLNTAGGMPMCIAGQVLQPGQEVIRYDDWKPPWFQLKSEFPFNSDRRQRISDVMAGNLCLDRGFALGIGGFDENFKGAALYFESEFARRVVAANGVILFEPSVSIRHLRATRGGTRARGGQLTTWRPDHSVGKYYFAFVGGPRETVKALLLQPLRAVRTKHHLKAPWWIPATLSAEVLGIVWALLLVMKGPKLLKFRSDTNGIDSDLLVPPGPENVQCHQEVDANDR